MDTPMEGAAAEPPAAGPARKAAGADNWYSMNEEAIDEVRSAKAWMHDANYFSRVMVSPAASMKMLMHAHSGCEAGASLPPPCTRKKKEALFL